MASLIRAPWAHDDCSDLASERNAAATGSPPVYEPSGLATGDRRAVEAGGLSAEAETARLHRLAIDALERAYRETGFAELTLEEQGWALDALDAGRSFYRRLN